MENVYYWKNLPSSLIRVIAAHPKLIGLLLVLLELGLLVATANAAGSGSSRGWGGFEYAMPDIL